MATLSIRSIGIRDIVSLRHLRDVRVPLSYPDSGLQEVLADLLAAVPYGRRFSRAFVATVDNDLRALVEFQPEPQDYRWLVTRLAASAEPNPGDQDARIELWSELLRYAARVAGASGTKRFHAAAPPDGLALQALREAEFTAYARQSVLLAQGLHPSERRDVPVREQEPSDVWSIHHLYHLTTPRAVQHAEAFSSNHWQPCRRAGSRVRGFILDHGLEPVAYCRVISRGRQHAIEVLAHEEGPELLRDLIPEALKRTGVASSDAVWAHVPDYHVEYLTSLESLGFQAVARQTLMVRYTTAPARTALVRWPGVVPGVAHRLAGRIPSYSAAGRVADPS